MLVNMVWGARHAYSMNVHTHTYSLVFKANNQVDVPADSFGCGQAIMPCAPLAVGYHALHPGRRPRTCLGPAGRGPAWVLLAIGD